ncbi:MAG: hypothetical protein J6K39_00385 [Clostridia bacterium]|nr:hypothetical protein [Clostridia bacterium]
MAKVYMEMGGVLKNFCVIGEKGRVRVGMMSRADKTFVKNMKGSTLGRIFVAQAVRPFRDC